MYHKLINIMSTVLRCSGYWPTTSSAAPILKIFNFMLRFFNFGVFLCLTAVIIGDAITNFNNLSLITDNLCFSIGCFEAAAKAFRFYSEYDNIVLLINYIYEPFDKLQKMGNIEVMTKLDNLARFELKQISIVTGIVSILALSRIFGADIGKKEFPIRAYFPFEAYTSPRYELLYVAITYGVFCVDFTLLVIDMMIVVIMRYLTFQLKILLANYKHCHVKSIKETKDNFSSGMKIIKNYHAITNTTDDDENGDDQAKDDIQNFVIFELNKEDVNEINNFDWRFKQCVIHHQKLVNMMTILNNSFSFCVVVQIMGSIVLLCLNGFQILLGKDDSHLFLRRVMAITAVILQLYFWCWYGNNMSTEADALTYHQWMCGWENEFRRGISNSVTTSMILSLRSLDLRAMGLVPLSLQTFISAIKNSYSVLVLLLTVVDD
ncbi:GSCOCT00010942001.3-RA-CDS, partial [Cotesia congregata]